MALRILDEFLEDETILGLADRSYRLHVSALLYCSRNLTDGEVTDRAVKVLQAILGYTVKRNVDELVKVGLWEPIDEDGYRIRNYLEFNPKAEVVKAEKSKARDRMRRLREKRARGEESPAPSDEGSPEHDGEHAPAVPIQAFPGPSLAQKPGRQSDAPEPLGAGLAEAIERARTASEERSKGLPIEIEFQVGRLMKLIGDHADDGTRHIIESYAKRLPQASIAKVIESLQFADPRNRAAYAVAALRDEVEQREVA